MSFEHPADYLRNAPYQDPTTILVLVVMGQGADPKTGLLWRYIDTLAEECRISARSARRILRKLIADGFVERQPRYRADGSQRSNMWRMFLTAEAAVRKSGGNVPFPPGADAEEICDPEDRPSVTGGGVTHDRGGCHPRQGGGVTHDREGVSPMTPLVKTLLKDPIERPSLARSAPNDPSRGRAPAREREIDENALKRDPLYGAFVRALNYEPQTRQAWDEWRIGIKELNRLEATPQDVHRAVNAFYDRFPKATCTVRATVKWWAALKEGKSHDVAKLEASQRASEIRRADEQRRREQQHAEAERLRAEIERDIANGVL
jgi:hypothetical protein